MLRQREAYLEEIAYSMEWIGAEELARKAAELVKTGYGDYLRQIVF